MSSEARDRHTGGTPADERARADAIAADALIEDFDWAVPHPGTTAYRFVAPSGALACWSLGDPDGERVLLLPGATGSKEDFVLLAPILADAGYHVQSFDLAGQFESAAAGPGRGGHYDWELYLADLAAFLEDGGPAHVLGYSFAGLLAQLLVVDRPELFRSLTLLTSPPRAGHVFKGMKVVGPILGILPHRLGGWIMRMGITLNANHVEPQRLAFVRRRLKVTNHRSVDDIVRLMTAVPNVRAGLHASGIPMLVATGEHDLWAVEDYAVYAEQIGAELAVYHTGHSPCETTPHQLALDMIRTFMLTEEPDR